MEWHQLDPAVLANRQPTAGFRKQNLGLQPAPYPNGSGAGRQTSDVQPQQNANRPSTSHALIQENPLPHDEKASDSRGGAINS